MFDFAVFSLAFAAISILLAKAMDLQTKTQRLTFPFTGFRPVPIKAPSQSGTPARAAQLLAHVH